MRTQFLAACLAAAAISPIASAQVSCEDQQKQRVAGTLVGGGIGAAIGGSVAGKGAKTEGAILGAILGGVIGNQATKSNGDCNHAYGFYDTQGRWHANNVDRTNARGFYGARGEWVEGPPRGRYVNNQWTAGGDGYYDANGRWVPPGVDGYYGPDNRWIAASASVNGPSAGPPRYDDRGDRDRFDRNDRGDPHDVVARIDRIRDRINGFRDRGDLGRRDARRLIGRLDDISYRQARMPHRGGYLYPADEDAINSQLDDVNNEARRLAHR